MAPGGLPDFNQAVHKLPDENHVIHLVDYMMKYSTLNQVIHLVDF